MLGLCKEDIVFLLEQLFFNLPILGKEIGYNNKELKNNLFLRIYIDYVIHEHNFYSAL